MKHTATAKRICMALTALCVGAAQADDAAVRATLQRTFPQAAIQGIQKTPVPGIVEAAVGGRVVYVTEDGLYLLAVPRAELEMQLLRAAKP
jgi:thiol:disulfide interchange protein DsbC